MALVLLPGLTNLIDDISEEKKLPPQVVEAALREALLKGYERLLQTVGWGFPQPLAPKLSVRCRSQALLE